jgi:hypothetical protein
MPPPSRLPAREDNNELSKERIRFILNSLFSPALAYHSAENWLLTTTGKYTRAG